jgi:hypothetical protein
MIVYARGPILLDQVVIGSPAEVVDAILEAHLPGAGARVDRAIARRAVAISVCEEVQAVLLRSAIRRGFWSYSGASSQEVDRLTRSREITDRDGPWKSRQVPLILVRPEGDWEQPTGRCMAMDPATDELLIAALVKVTWLEVGRLD